MVDSMIKKIVKGSEVAQKMGPARSALPSVGTKGGVVSKAELSAQEKAQKLIEEAQREALYIKAEADKLYSQIKDEMERVKLQGYHEGKEAGQAGLMEEILKVREEKEQFFSKAEPEIIKLVMVIAEKVIGRLVEEHKEAIHSIIHQALERSLGDRIVVKVNPQDLKRLQTEDLTFKDLLDRTKHLHFREDESVQPGGCMVETEVGTIDAQLETQLKAIRKALGI